MRRTIACIFFLAMMGYAAAQQPLRQEPAPGELRPGERVLVDDHTCPHGQIKEVIGGSNRRHGTLAQPGTQRMVRCVPR